MSLPPLHRPDDIRLNVEAAALLDRLKLPIRRRFA